MNNMEKRYSVAEVKAQMSLLAEMLEVREAFISEAIDINKDDRANIDWKDKNSEQDYDLLINEILELKERLANIRIALCNVKNDLLRLY